ncbi:hypothetical protein PHSC3_000537 [Chlamydiales bacterium STE3]|nr:hypothetical protein PHSC3_000537 [Chlamydiales bacterium STE3]
MNLEEILRKYPEIWQQELIKEKFSLILKQISSDASFAEKQIKEYIICSGQDLKLPSVQQFPPIIQAVFNSLFTENAVHFNKKELLYSLFVKADQDLLKKFRELIQLVLNTFFEQLQKKEDTLPNRLFIHHVIAYYSFFGAEENEPLKIPQKIGHRWFLCDYVVNKIALTPAGIGSQVIAFGLFPITKEAPPILLFKGTSYPSDEGFALSLLTDFNPGASVGRYAFLMGKMNILAWMDQHSKKTMVIGLSLGGALALHTATTFPQHICKVFAFNPPALLKNELHAWEVYSSQHKIFPEINVIYHENDLVPSIGFRWGSNWNIYRIYLNRKKFFLEAHTRCFIAEESHLILKIDPHTDAKKLSRFLLASLHQGVSVFLFPLGCVLHFLKMQIKNLKKIFFKLPFKRS